MFSFIRFLKDNCLLFLEVGAFPGNRKLHSATFIRNVNLQIKNPRCGNYIGNTPEEIKYKYSVFFKRKVIKNSKRYTLN